MRIPQIIFLCRVLFWGCLSWPLSGIAASERDIEVNRNDLSVQVGGRPAPREIRMQEGQVFFHFVAPPGGPNSVERFSFKLEGCDPEWREYVSGVDCVMRVAVLFYDKDGNWLAQKDFGVKGNSPGWTGTPEDSPLRSRNELFSVPNGAVALAILISSAGPPQELGTLAVGALTISKVADKNTVPIFRLEFPKGEGLKAPIGWNRSGPHPSAAQIVHSNTKAGCRLLAVRDDDLFSHGEWQSDRIRPGLALKRMAESLAAGLNIQIELRQEIGDIELPSLVEDNLLRIAQESITNAIKNAGASVVTIDLAATPTHSYDSVLIVQLNARL